MINSHYSRNPFIKGLKPRKFFEQSLEDLKKSQMRKDGRKFNPDWKNKAA